MFKSFWFLTQASFGVITVRGALAGTRNSSMGPPHEGSIRRPITPWVNSRPLSYVPLPYHWVTQYAMFKSFWFLTQASFGVITVRGALAGTRNSSMGPPHEGSIRRPIAPWVNSLPLSYVPLPYHWVTQYAMFKSFWFLTQASFGVITVRGALAGTRNSSMGPPHEGSIRRPLAPWVNSLPLSYVPLPTPWRIDPTTHRTMSEQSTSELRPAPIPLGDTVSYV